MEGIAGCEDSADGGGTWFSRAPKRGLSVRSWYWKSLITAMRGDEGAVLVSGVLGSVVWVEGGGVQGGPATTAH